jgi:hypothetical protein
MLLQADILNGFSPEVVKSTVLRDIPFYIHAYLHFDFQIENVIKSNNEK